MLAKKRLDTNSNAVAISGKLDVENFFDTRFITIESERFNIGKKTSALDDSIKRLFLSDKFRVMDA